MLNAHTSLYFEVLVGTKCTFFVANVHALIGRPRAFSRASGCWVRRSSARTLRCMFGPRPSSVARSVGVQTRASWLFFKGSRSATPSHAGTWKPPQFQLFWSRGAVVRGRALIVNL